MLQARGPSLRVFVALQLCSTGLPSHGRYYRSDKTTNSGGRAAPNRKTGPNGVSPRAVGNPQSAQQPSRSGDGVPTKPSLIEQLFPEESKRYEEQQRASREVPRLPLDSPVAVSGSKLRRTRRSDDAQHKSRAARQLQRQAEATDAGTAVLVLRNASANLTEEDFRRLIPQGRHIEGWTLDQGNILKVIPGRDLATLAQQNVYYLLFSSAASAFTYQGHATRIHRLAASHSPASVSSPIPPPPGYMIEGLDVHAAMEAYALVPPTQRLELRQLEPPLSPLMQSLVRHQGYAAILQRKDKMPFEVRLTMEGPQLAPSTIRHIMMETGKSRALSWSGGDSMNLSIKTWEPRRGPTPHDDTLFAQQAVERRVENDQIQRESSERSQSVSTNVLHKRRGPFAVYIVGFYTENAAQGFVRYWHRRPLGFANDETAEHAEGDLPPIANVELLW